VTKTACQYVRSSHARLAKVPKTVKILTPGQPGIILGFSLD